MEIKGAFFLDNGLGLLVVYLDSEEEDVKKLDFAYRGRKLYVSLSCLNETYVLLKIGDREDLVYVINKPILRYLSEHPNIFAFFMKELDIVATRVYTFTLDSKDIYKLEGMLDLLERLKKSSQTETEKSLEQLNHLNEPDTLN